MENNNDFQNIDDLSKQHKKSGDELDDIKYSDALENEAWDIVFNYCKENNYEVPELYAKSKPSFNGDNVHKEKN